MPLVIDRLHDQLNKNFYTSTLLDINLKLDLNKLIEDFTFQLAVEIDL